MNTLKSAAMAKPTPDQLDIVAAYNSEVGLLCSQWSYLEWMLEIAVFARQIRRRAKHRNGWKANQCFGSRGGKYRPSEALISK
jgi:hypothetical protein